MPRRQVEDVAERLKFCRFCPIHDLFRFGTDLEARSARRFAVAPMDDEDFAARVQGISRVAQ